MHYYQHHIGDFIKSTNYLTNEEIGIYMKLIWLYYDTEQPLPNNLFVLSMKTNARDKEVEVNGILEMFFKLENDQWHNTRCDKEIALYQKFCNKQKENGIKGGRPKLTQNKPNGLVMGYEDKPNDNQSITQDEPKITLTTNHKPLTTNHINTITPNGVSDEVFQDYLMLRKGLKAPVTNTVLKSLEKEGRKANMSLEQVMTICCQNGWRGFKADWMKTDEQKKLTPHQASVKSVGLAIFGNLEENYNDNIIDIDQTTRFLDS